MPLGITSTARLQVHNADLQAACRIRRAVKTSTPGARPQPTTNQGAGIQARVVFNISYTTGALFAQPFRCDIIRLPCAQVDTSSESHIIRGLVIGLGLVDYATSPSLLKKQSADVLRCVDEFIMDRR